jgi:uncharacterized repeat protein (TIGR03803 family)
MKCAVTVIFTFFAFMQGVRGEFVFQIFYSFGISNSAPRYPKTGLVQAADGKLYGGTRYSGDSFDSAKVYRISFNGTLTNLPFYIGGGSLNSLGGKLLQSRDGNLYGTVTVDQAHGGTFGGALFRLAPDDTMTTLAAFWGTNGTGSEPIGALIQASDGSLMGATFSGGIDIGLSSGFGTIFQFRTNGIFSGLLSFVLNQTTGYCPRGGLIEASDGNLYGTTSDAILGNYSFGATRGTIYRISSQGFETIFTFYGTNGAIPSGNLLQGQDGALYGTTTFGGEFTNGTIFKITTNGIFTSLLSFSGKDGANPTGDLIQLADGYLYGTTTAGGSNNLGTIFRITTDGVVTSMFSFKSSTGYSPQGGLCLARDGNLYGTTSTGGPGGGGTIFRLVSAPLITSARQSNNAVILNWSSFTDALYRVEYRTNSQSGNWFALATNVQSAGPTTSFSDSIVGDTQRFYRVVLLPP